MQFVQQTTDQLWPVPVQLLGMVALELKQHGVPVAKLLAGTDIGEEHLFDPERTVPYRTATAILSTAMALSPIPDLAFAVGAKQSPSALGVLGYGVNCCETLREAAQIIRNYHRVSSTLLLGDLQEGNSFFRWTATAPVDLGPLLPFLVEEEFYTIRRSIDILIGEPVPLVEIHVQHEKPEYADKYDDFFRCPVIFSSECNQMVMPLEILDIPIVNANPLSAKAAKRLCEDFLTAHPAADDLIAQVQQLTLQEPRMQLREKTVAARLNITSRTLRNRLKKQNTSFREIVNELREQIARKQLTQAGLNVSEIAEQVGYSDARAFRRAFKQWTGMTPEMFRNQSNRVL